MHRLILLFTALHMSLVVGCGGKTAGEALIPKAPEAHGVRAREHVPVVEGSGEPLIVDWEPEARTDLEVKMRDGVTVVAYSTEGLRLLKDCSVDGSYGFVQVAPKTQMIRLQSRDEVRANLPTSAGKMIQVHGDVGRGRGIEIDMTIVGKFRTTRHRITFPMLRGTCTGATHFVRGATVGAFAMRTSAEGWASSGAEALGAELGGSAQGRETVENRDGDPEACAEKSQADLLNGCGALLRLELAPVSNEAKEAREASEDPAAAALNSSCPSGFVLAENKCSRPKDDALYTCSPDNLSDCYRQCEAGDARSCVIAGVRQRDGSVTTDGPRTRELFERACRDGDALGCTLLGDMYRFGSGVQRDVLAAATHYRRGCEEGVAAACRQLATMFYYGDGLTQDLAQAVSLYNRGCDAGDQRSCSLLGDLFMTSSGEFHLPARAVALFLRACEGDDVAGCLAHVRAIEFGVGISADVPDAIARKHRLCDRSPALCGQLGVSYLAGRGVHHNADAARRLLTKSCAALPNEKGADAWGEADLYAFYSCLVVERRFGGPGASRTQKAAMAARLGPVLGLIARRCQKDAAFECFDGGYLFALAGDEEGARALWDRGCQFENQESCDTLEASRKGESSSSGPPVRHSPVPVVPPTPGE